MRQPTVLTRLAAPRSAQRGSGRPRSAALLLAGVVVAVGLAGCGSGDDVTTVPGGGGEDQTTDGDEPVTSEPSLSGTESPTRSPGSDTGADGEPTEADLTVAVDDGAGGVTTSTLTCSGTDVGGTLATASEACSQLAEVGAEALAPPPADQMCTEIYGGPQTATVTGTFAGGAVEASLARTNGCEIARWDALSALLGPVDADS